LVVQPPSDFDNRIYADRALQQFNSEDPTVAARSNTKRIEELIRTLEERGARVFLFEQPYSEPIEGSRAAVIT
jgi:uroporphyrinogen-III synthase